MGSNLVSQSPLTARSSDASPWLAGVGSNPGASIRLFCVPFAGGGASAFRDWRFAKGYDLEVSPVNLPGRERRIDEEPCRELGMLVERLVQAVPVDRTFALFGHSMGALICFELARALTARGTPPEALFVSGFRAPHLPRRGSLKHLLPDAEFLDEIRELGGSNPETLQHPELQPILLRQLRADLQLVETYIYRATSPLPCPVTAFGGSADPEVSEADMRAWESHTSGRFRLEMFPGGHFYLYGAERRLMSSICWDLEQS